MWQLRNNFISPSYASEILNDIFEKIIFNESINIGIGNQVNFEKKNAHLTKSAQCWSKY